MNYFIVIGKEKDTDDNPLAETLCQIGKAMGKDIRVFETSSTGTCEFDSEEVGSEAEKKLTKDVVLETLASFDKSDYRLLLFDAESISGALEPVSGLLVWYQYYSTLQSGTKASYKGILDFFNEENDFFNEGSNGLWWAGFVKPSNYKVETLAEARWKIVNSRLKHDSQKQGGA
ncbi:MAG: hypothetical protein KAJ90_04070 [Desulfobacterales bacterium]|nr:hypothetical protein [Desulfobacterales bacterium]